MDQEQSTVTSQDGTTPSEPASSVNVPITYDSNPFTSTRMGIQKLIRLNAQTTIGVVLFNVLLFVLLGFTIVVIALSVLAFAIKYAPDILGMAVAPAAGLSFFSSMSDSSIYATWVIGLALCIVIMSLIQVIQLQLTISSAQGQAIKFGAVLKQSFRSILPVLGYVGLTILALIAAVVVLALLSNVLGFITAIIGIILMLAALFAAFRLTFTAYSIVHLGLGPIAGIKQSWKLTDGHVIETIGSASVGIIIFIIPTIVLSALARATQSVAVLSSIFSLLQLVLVLVLVIFSAVALAERYVQLDAVLKKTVTPTSLSPFNFLAIAIVIILLPIANTLSPNSTNLNSGTNPFDTMNTSNPDPSALQAPTNLN